MKNLSNKQLVLIKKSVGCICGLLCLIFMFLNVFKYTSSTSIYGGEDNLTWREGVSVFSFLFTGNKEVLETNVSVLREILSFSYVVTWISFVVQGVSFGVLIYGVFSKKSLFSKIGSVALLVGVVLLLLVNFNVHELGKTIRYLSTFNVIYFICVVLSVLGLFSTFTVKDK